MDAVGFQRSEDLASLGNGKELVGGLEKPASLPEIRTSFTSSGLACLLNWKRTTCVTLMVDLSRVMGLLPVRIWRGQPVVGWVRVSELFVVCCENKNSASKPNSPAFDCTSRPRCRGKH